MWCQRKVQRRFGKGAGAAGTDLGHHGASPVGKLELFVLGNTSQGGNLLHDCKRA